MSIQRADGCFHARGMARRTVSVAAIAVFFVCSTASARATQADSPRPTMRAVFQEMKELIPLSLDETRWSDPASQEKVLAALHRLEIAASALQDHGRSHEPGFREIAINLGVDLSEAHERYRLGAFEEARFFLTGSLQSCVSCHVRLPSDRDFPFADELMKQIEIDALSPREKAWMLVIVRRFDEALETWEGLIADPKIPASELDASGVLVDYLNVALRVRGAIDRSSKTLSKFRLRKDLPFYLERRVGEWIQALGELDSARFVESAPPSLSLGTSLAEKAGQIVAGPYGRDGLIQDLAGASQLVRWLEQDRSQMSSVTRNRTPKERQEAALAYYWLGIIEARSLDGFWVNLSERHLEAAVRSDPKGPIAAKAYALLEETQILGYGGSSSDHLPTDVWNLLEELRTLISPSE